MIRGILFFWVIAAIVVGCYPGGAEFTDELDLVLTTYDKTYPFSSKKTYSIPTRIPEITGENQLPDYIDDATSKIILDQINSNMTKQGYVKVASAQSADILVQVAAMKVTTVSYYCYPSYWYYYPTCYYPSATAYSTGTIFITIEDADATPGTIEDPITGVWGVTINGLLSSTSSNNSRIMSTIDQAFVQSPYVKAN